MDKDKDKKKSNVAVDTMATAIGAAAGTPMAGIAAKEALEKASSAPEKKPSAGEKAIEDNKKSLQEMRDLAEQMEKNMKKKK